MATFRIPPSRSLMCAAVYDEKTGQQPIVVNGNKLHIFPDWYNCHQQYLTEMTSEFADLKIKGSGVTNDTWIEPWESPVDMSGTKTSIFEITPQMLMIQRGSFADDKSFYDYVNLLNETWGVKFRYSDKKNIAFAVCPSKKASGNNVGQFYDRAIEGSICFCIKVDRDKPDETGGYNGWLRTLLLKLGKSECYVICEVDPDGLVFSELGAKLKTIAKLKEDTANDAYSYCVKGIRIFKGIKSTISLDEVGDEYSNSVKDIYLGYTTLEISARIPTMYNAVMRYFPLKVSTDFLNDNYTGNIPKKVPLRTSITTAGSSGRELG